MDEFTCNFDQFRSNKRRVTSHVEEEVDLDLELDAETNESESEDDADLDLELDITSSPTADEQIAYEEEQSESSVTEADDQPKKREKNSWSGFAGEIRYNQFVMCGTELFILKKDKNDKWKKEFLADLVYIKEILENVDEQTFQFVLRYWYKSKWRELLVKRSQLQLNELTKLLDHGVDVPNYKAGQIAKFLSLQEKDAPLKQVHEKLGWSDHNGNLLYKHQKIHGSDLPYSSTYAGKLLLQKGTFEGWKDVIEREVLGYTPLEFALVCGFASPLVSLIAQIVDLEVLLFHAYGDTTQGKTTAGRVFVSPFGFPSKREGGLILQWYGTKNGIVIQLADIHGLPIVLDEASMNRMMKDFTDFVYLLAEGRDKARSTKEIKERRRASWSGVFFSTAEHSLQQKANQNGGVVVRVTERGNVKWTRSAENAKNIKAGLLKNYGHAGPMFVEFLITKGKEAVIDVWKKWSKKCYKEMEIKDDLSDRLADKYALILATAELMNECFEFKVNIDGIMDFLLEMDQESVAGRDLGVRAYEYLEQMVVQHQSKFIQNGRTPNGECWGKISLSSKRGVEVTFLQEAFKNIVAEGGFDDYTVVLRKLKEKKVLDHEANKFTRKRRMNSSSKGRELVYVIWLDNSVRKLLQKETVSPEVIQRTGRDGKLIVHDQEEEYDIFKDDEN